MSSLELNKIAASIILAALIAMLVGSFVDLIYKPNLDPKERGYQIAVEEQNETATSSSEPETDPFEDIKSLMQTASVENGKSLFSRCSSCHTINKGDAHRVGPNLWNTLGMKKAGHDGYNYSSAFRALEGEWDYLSLARFLHNPRQYVPGTKMSFAGLRRPSDVADLVAYLREYSDEKVNLP